MIYRNLCEICGAELQKVSEAKYACRSCGNVYTAEKAEKYSDKMSELFDGTKLEMICNAKKNLYAAITAEHIGKNEVIKWCDEVKKYLPDDFQANFYESFINGSKREVAKSIRKINVEEHFECLESLIVFVIKSLEKSYVTSTKDLIERAYKLYDSDTDKYVKYITMVEDEAEKLDKCVYDTKLPRKAFVAYSSKDSDKAIELVEVLEAQGISCFISLRNLRHGVGSKENYDKALKEAMDNCMSFVFVSSMNSRNIECDAYNIEMPYVKQKDINNAPGQYRNFYSKIPQEYKKPRVEYRIQESTEENFADDLVDEFFEGYERVHTLKDVALRIIKQSQAKEMEIAAKKDEEVQTVVEAEKKAKELIKDNKDNKDKKDKKDNNKSNKKEDNKQDNKNNSEKTSIFQGLFSKMEKITQDTLPPKDVAEKSKNVDSNQIYEQNGNKIKFGSYPQTRVRDRKLINELNKKADEISEKDKSVAWISYHYYIERKLSDYMWYIDVEHKGKKYRGVFFSMYRPRNIKEESSVSTTEQLNNGYHNDTVYWFKYEPISWTVLSKNKADKTVFMLCDMIIDSQPFDNYKNNYAESRIRRWLNQKFFNTAFTEQQRKIILTTTVDNSASSTENNSNPNACSDTQDKIFLLSYKEVNSSNYFPRSADDKARKKKITEYARSQGVKRDGGKGCWRLRSLSNENSVYAHCVNYWGGTYCDEVHYTSVGVVPALQIKL